MKRIVHLPSTQARCETILRRPNACAFHLESAAHLYDVQPEAEGSAPPGSCFLHVAESCLLSACLLTLSPSSLFLTAKHARASAGLTVKDRPSASGSIRSLSTVLLEQRTNIRLTIPRWTRTAHCLPARPACLTASAINCSEVGNLFSLSTLD